MKHNKLLIIGAGGHGKVVADIARKTNRYDYIAFIDDNHTTGSISGLPVLGGKEFAVEHKDEYDAFVAIGDPRIRQCIQEYYEANGVTVATLIHPDSVIAPDVRIGSGTVMMAGTVVNSESVIGRGVIINTSSSVDHDNIIADYAHISVGAHLAGSVSVGERSWIGIGAVVSNNISICPDVMVGAGAVVIKNIIEPGTYIGIPAVKH